MGLNDLGALISNDIKMDAATEKRVCDKVLHCLKDKSNDVQTKAVNVLAIIVPKVQQSQVNEIGKQLCDNILAAGQAVLRDIYSMGLNQLIADIQEVKGPGVVATCVPLLIDGISRPDDSVAQFSLEIMSNMLKRFGLLMKDRMPQILSLVQDKLVAGSANVRKKAANCLSSIAVVSSDELLFQLVDRLLAQLDQFKSKPDYLHTLIQAIGNVSLNVGFRLGKHLHRIIPVFIHFVGDPDDERQWTNQGNDLREHCFTGLESFVLRCPREVSPFVLDVLQLSLVFAKFDYNYNYGDSDADGSEHDEEDEEEDYASDDEDTSWKVRKAAVKTVRALIGRPEVMRADVFERCCSELVGQFREHADNVRVEVISCFALLLTVVTQVEASGQSASLFAKTPSSTPRRRTPGSSPRASSPRAVQSSANMSQVLEKVPRLMKVCKGLLTHRRGGGGASLKTKSAVFSMLTVLFGVPGFRAQLQPYFSSFLKDLVVRCMSDTAAGQQNLKVDALAFIRALFENFPADFLRPSVAELLHCVVVVAGEGWYKIIAESLRVMSVIITVIGSLTVQDALVAQLAAAVHASLLPRLGAMDINQEIKECSISCAGVFLSTLGRHVSAAMFNDILSILKRRLDNEITRTAALKALTQMATSL